MENMKERKLQSLREEQNYHLQKKEPYMQEIYEFPSCFETGSSICYNNPKKIQQQ